MLYAFDQHHFAKALWHINHFRSFNAKSSYTSTSNIYGFAELYGISTTVGYLIPNPHYIYIKYVEFCWNAFYGISTIVGYLMPNPLYIYSKYMEFGLVGFGFMAYQPS